MKINFKKIIKLLFLIVEIGCILMIISFAFLYFILKKGDLLFFLTGILFFGIGIPISHLIRKEEVSFTIAGFLNMGRKPKIIFGICSLVFSLNGLYSAFLTPEDKLIDFFGAFLFGLGGIALLLPDTKIKNTTKQHDPSPKN